jgi:hypothetical protein
VHHSILPRFSHPTFCQSFCPDESISVPKATFACNMGDHSESTSFRALFESAFQAYEKTTGISLTEHPLAMQIQSCHPVESMTALVQDQASAFNEFRGNDRVTQLVKTTLSILTKLFTAASLGDAVGLVCRNGPAPDGCSAGTSDAFHSRSHLSMPYTLPLLFYLLVWALPSFLRGYMILVTPTCTRRPTA